MFSIGKVLWHYRGFIIGNVKRDFQSKYQNSLLGATWNILNPLSMIIIYTVIFSRVMHSKVPNISDNFGYSIYLCSGILLWGLFSEIVGRGLNIFIDNANLMKKINFPKLCLPITAVFNSAINFSIIFILFLFFLIILNKFPGLVIFALIPVLIVLVIFAVGLGITLGILNIFFRDTGQIFGIFTQFWFWLTPVIYPVQILPERVREYLPMNPMYGIITSSQKILLNGELPNFYNLLPALIAGMLFSLIGLHLFRKHSGEMVDEL